MPTRPVSLDQIQYTVDTWHACLDEGWPNPPVHGQPSALGVAAERVGLAQPNTAAARLDIAVALGIKVQGWRVVDAEWASKQRLRYQRYDDYTPPSSPAVEPRSAKPGRRARLAHPSLAAVPPAPSDHPISAAILVDQIIPALRKAPLTLDELADKFKTSTTSVALAIELAHAQGAALASRGGRWHLDTAPPMGSQRDHKFQLTTDENGYLEFGGCSDQHLGSKYYRDDCLQDYYDEVARRGIKIVLNGGNWIDGEAVFNKHDLSVHGMDAQVQYLAKHYPQRPGVETWAIAGADHEGFYSRREGVDIGRYAENVMRQAGRADWHDMGYMECFIPIVHGATGKSVQLCLMHPGGGSSYAISYAPQKIIEGFSGGDKPAVLLLGHYHKASYQLTRNVHCVQLGAFQDQTVFMRQKKIDSHIGGWFLSLRLDPETGAVIEFTSTFRPYFVRGYYNNRWSQHGPVTHTPRLG